MRSFSAVFIMSFKYLWRNPVSVSVIIAAPIVFILILGNALSFYISPDVDFEPVSIAVVTDDKNSGFSEFIKSDEVSQFLTSAFTDETTAREMMADGLIKLAVFEKDGEISVLKPGEQGSDTAIAMSVIDSYSKISVAAELAVKSGTSPFDVFKAVNSEFSVDGLPLGNRAPSATDYYAVTMLVYILLLAGMNGMELFNKCLLGDMGARIMTAPISKPVLVGGLISASAITSFLQGMVTFVFSAAVYGVYWGERIPLVLMAFFGVVLFSQSFCIFFLLLFRGIGIASGVTQAIFFASTFVSKGYSKLSFGETADKIFAYTPNSLAHTAIFGAIFGGNESSIIFSTALIFALGIIFFTAAFLLGRRRLA